MKYYRFPIPAPVNFFEPFLNLPNFQPSISLHICIRVFSHLSIHTYHYTVYCLLFTSYHAFYCLFYLSHLPQPPCTREFSWGGSWFSWHHWSREKRAKHYYRRASHHLLISTSKYIVRRLTIPTVAPLSQRFSTFELVCLEGLLC